jgi:hypothetical protein
MCNVKVIQQAIGLRELTALPRTDFMLHLNVLHHAGHDFDSDLLPERSGFESYARHYLTSLRETTSAMFFQMGSNWGGERSEPLVEARADQQKLAAFSSWLRDAGWSPLAIAYAHRLADGRIEYDRLDTHFTEQSGKVGSWPFLDQFPGEFYRRPLFLCSAAAANDA